MSAKEDIEYIKKELDTEEKFLSGIAHAERFWKKFKKPLIGVASAFFIGIVGFYAFNTYEDSRINAANVALNKLLANPSDTAALDELKSKDAKLFEVYKMYTAASGNKIGELNELASSKAMFVSELSSYQAAALEKSASKLSAIANDKNALLHELATIDIGVLSLQKDDKKAAGATFAKIPQESMVKPEAIALEHFSQTTK